MALLQTYELYFEHADGRRTFEPLTCPGEFELVRVMRKRLEDGAIRSIDAKQGGEPIMSLTSGEDG